MLDVLVVDDDEIVRESVSLALVNAGHRVAQASDGEMAMSLFASRAFDLAICDVHMPKMDGLTLCRRLRREAPAMALVIMTSFGTVEGAVASLRGGVVDYVSKPFDPDEFAINVIGPIDERYALRKSFEEMRAQFVRRETGTNLVGTSLVMRQLVESITLASNSDASVLVGGERGTGKKLIARMIHMQSPRRAGPFVVVPCADLPALLWSSDERERFEMRSRGPRDEWFQSATGGTLVLDGVDHLSLAAEEALLRVIDETNLHARRSLDWIPLGVRVVSLLTEDARDSRVRPSIDGPIHLRLRGMRLHVPPVRERDGDLYALVCHFLHELTPPARRAPGLSPRAWRMLTDYRFPGNVRELAWVLEHALALADGGEIDVQHLPEEVGETRSSGGDRAASGSSPW
jgi:two-component system, NtrC family, response regulator HydG